MKNKKPGRKPPKSPLPYDVGTEMARGFRDVTADSMARDRMETSFRKMLKKLSKYAHQFSDSIAMAFSGSGLIAHRGLQRRGRNGADLR